MEKVRFGIIGCGNMGTKHAENLANGLIKNGVLAAVCDIKPSRLDAMRALYGDTIAYFDCAEDMYKSGTVDVVHICTPHYDHPRLAIEAMDHHLHCVVEKPAGVYTKQVKEMLTRAESADTLLGIMFNQRTNPAFRKMREMIQNGAIGRIKRTNWIITDWYRTQEYYDSGAWRATWVGEGGGVLMNQAPHQLDLFQWITGMSPVRVRAFCHLGKWHDIEVEDDVTCYCEYENGATGVIITTTADAPGTNRFEVTGTKGTLLFEKGRLYYTELDIDEREYCFATRAVFATPPAKETVEIAIEGENTQHVGILNNVANAVLGLEPLYAPASDGIHGVELANAMLLSSLLDKTVTLPIDEDLFYEELKKLIATSKPRQIREETVTKV